MNTSCGNEASAASLSHALFEETLRYSFALADHIQRAMPVGIRRVLPHRTLAYRRRVPAKLRYMIANRVAN